MGDVVKVKLQHGTKILYRNILTGETEHVASTKNRLILTRGRLFKIPVDTVETLDEHNIFKTDGKLNEILDIRNIQDGFAFILPIISNISLQDGQILGRFL